MIKDRIKTISQFLLIVLITIGTQILDNVAVCSVWYVALLIMYFRSKNEGFWLAFFFVTTDGFFGFLGTYSTLLNLIPGMPGIELAQFYILLALVKISRQTVKTVPFYRNWTILLFCYILLLLVVGFVNGLSGDLNVYFKVAKMILPFALCYTTPRLFRNINDYAVLFDLLFMVFMVAFAAQIYTVFTGLSPSARFEKERVDEMELGRNLRSYYNYGISLVTLCGALFFSTLKEQKFFSKIYLNVVVICCFGMAFLSATRGSILGFGLIILFYNMFINKLQLKNLLLIIGVFIVLFTISLSFEKINKQLVFAFERSMTLEALAKGDETADGTLVRLERGPPVMEAWADNPIFGWGFSNVYFEKYDVHVGNQTLLLHSGVVGLLLLYGFIFYVCAKLVSLGRNKNSLNLYKKAGLVIPVFTLGWFLIHTTTVQQFAYLGIPNAVFPQAVILGLANFVITFKS